MMAAFGFAIVLNNLPRRIYICTEDAQHIHENWDEENGQAISLQAPNYPQNILRRIIQRVFGMISSRKSNLGHEFPLQMTLIRFPVFLVIDNLQAFYVKRARLTTILEHFKRYQ